MITATDTKEILIRESAEPDRAAIRAIHLEAFGPREGRSVAGLVDELFLDETAVPLLSLVAVDRESVVGHVLFSRARVMGTPGAPSARILAPLAVVPRLQRRGIGGRLVVRGLGRLLAYGVDLVFVLGHPGYYPRLGFRPAGALGYAAPQPIEAHQVEAWMVRALNPAVLGQVTGQVQCSEVLSRPEYWRE